MSRRKKGWNQSSFFLIIPKPQKDELLSSWLARTAFAHKRSLTSFLSLFVNCDGSSISRIDIDFRYSEKLFQCLVDKSFLSKEQILKMSLRSEEGYLYTCENNCLYPPKIIRKLIDKRTSHGLMYCPLCLSEDEIPYLRKEWRYEFYTACLKHEILLTDRCWVCYKPIRLKKMKVASGIVYCDNCGKDLRTSVRTKVTEPQEYGLQAIRWFIKGLEEGYFLIDDKKIHSLWVFQAMTRLKWLLEREKIALKLESFSLITEYKELLEKLEKYDSKKASVVYKQFYLTSMVYFLFQNYPHNLKNFAKDNHLTYRSFTHTLKDMSFWYENMIQKITPLQNKIGRVIAEDEVRGAIKYLKSQGVRVNQLEVSKIVGCHFTIHKQYVEIYQNIVR